jgi:hypothetical protein
MSSAPKMAAEVWDRFTITRLVPEVGSIRRKFEIGIFSRQCLGSWANSRSQDSASGGESLYPDQLEVRPQSGYKKETFVGAAATGECLQGSQTWPALE